MQKNKQILTKYYRGSTSDSNQSLLNKKRKRSEVFSASPIAKRLKVEKRYRKTLDEIRSTENENDD